MLTSKTMNINRIINKSQRNYSLIGGILTSTRLESYRISTICKCSNWILSKKLNIENATIRRNLCNQTGPPPSNRLPPLTNLPKITWPSIFKSLRNLFLTTFIIRPYFDPDFNLPDFVAGSKKAVEVVSRKLGEGDVKSLEGLVTNDLIQMLQRTISLMSLPQREQISIALNDIYFAFPYQIGIIFDDETENAQKRYVEITMVYHSLRGLSAMRERGEEPPLNMGMMPEYQNLISICNYRFIREFTKGVESDWTINLLNHFKPIDEIK